MSGSNTEDMASFEAASKLPNFPASDLSFEALPLNPRLLKAIENMGFCHPSRTQVRALPLLMGTPLDLVVQAQSGTGKSVTMVLAMLSKVDVTKQYPQVLCMLPTFELAVQVGEMAKQMALNYEGLEILMAIRSNDARGQRLTQHVIIGTPGRVLDLFHLYRLLDLSQIKVFALDEVDVMLAEKGHREQCMVIINNLHPSCQKLFLLTSHNHNDLKFAETLLTNPITIKLEPGDVCLPNIKHFYVFCEDSVQKYDIVTKLCNVLNEKQTIIFCRSKRTVFWLAKRLERANYSVELITSVVPLEERLTRLKRFQHCDMKILVTTDLLSRGIDFPQVSVVINYDIPMETYHVPDYASYINRMGRTGQQGRPGVVINVTGDFYAFILQKKIESKFNVRCRYVDHTKTDDLLELLSQVWM